MEVTNNTQINVLNNFQVFIPLSGDADAFAFTQTTSPSFGLTLTRTDSHESYHYQIQMLQSNGVSEVIIPNGLTWAKRAPYLFQKKQNTSIIEALVCRLRIPSGIFDFRRAKHRSVRFVVRCFSNNVLLSTGLSQSCRVLPKKRVAGEEAEENGNVIIPIYWARDSPENRSDPTSDCLPQNELEEYQEYQDEDSVMVNLNDSEEQFQSYSNDGDSDELSRIVSNTSYLLAEPESIVANDQSSHYMVLYNGNAEVIGNFRALNFYKASDINIKEDVRLLTEDRDPRSVLLKIDGVEYKFKEGSTNAPMNKRFVGYIAQQIENVVPEAVQLIDGILHVDYESLIPYLSESIKQNFHDITDLKSDTRHIHRVIDMMYQEFIKKEKRKNDESTVKSVKQYCHTRGPMLRWIVGTSLAVLLMISVAVATFFVMPLFRPDLNTDTSPNAPNSPATTVPSPLPSPTTPSPAYLSIDHAVVAELYNATGACCDQRGLSTSSNNVCEWLGVACNGDLRVVGLELYDFNLVGTIPDSIGRLDKLQSFRLYQANKIYGTIPASIGNLTNLDTLILANSQFTGSVPLEIFSLPSLKVLQLSNNGDLSWTIPPQISNLKNLQQFEARRSGLYGTIPNEISQLTHLRVLSLGYNNLTGTMPSLANTSVTRLILDKNQFTGPVPKLNEKLFFQTGRQELILSVAKNNFSGEFYVPLLAKNKNCIDIEGNQFTSVSSQMNNVTMPYMSCFATGNPFTCPMPEWFKTSCHATCR